MTNGEGGFSIHGDSRGTCKWSSPSLPFRSPFSPLLSTWSRERGSRGRDVQSFLSSNASLLPSLSSFSPSLLVIKRVCSIFSLQQMFLTLSGPPSPSPFLSPLRGQEGGMFKVSSPANGGYRPDTNLSLHSVGFGERHGQSRLPCSQDRLTH